MAARDWRQILADAALAAGEAGAADRAAPLLDAVVNGSDGDRSTAATSLRALVTALDGAARSRRSSWDAAELVTARAALRVLPRLIKQLDRGVTGSAVAGLLADLTAAGSRPADDGAPTAAGWRCPRCGSHRIDEQHTDGTGMGRFVELFCEACGAYGGFTSGNPGQAAWRS